jgi:ribonuclease P protein component
MDEAAGAGGILYSRFAFTASRRVGNAVSRNRAKRLLRAAVLANLSAIRPGWDCLFIARKGTPDAAYETVEMAVSQLLSRAEIRAKRSPASGRKKVQRHE